MFRVRFTELIMAEMFRSQFVTQRLKYSPPRVRIDLNVLRCPLIYRFEVFPSNDSTGVQMPSLITIECSFQYSRCNFVISHVQVVDHCS